MSSPFIRTTNLLPCQRTSVGHQRFPCSKYADPTSSCEDSPCKPYPHSRPTIFSICDRDQTSDMLHLELGPPFVVDDFDSKLHSPSSPLVAPFSVEKDAAQRTTIHAPYDTRSLGSKFTSSSQSDYTESDTPDTDPNVQYITIYPSHSSPIRPSTFDFPTTEPDTHSYFGDDEDHDDEQSTIDSLSLSGKVMGIVCDTFIGELRRMIPGGERFEFDADLYEKMDDRLIQAPADVFYDLCLEESSPSNRTPPTTKAVSDDSLEVLNEPIDLAEEWFRAIPQILPPIHRPTTGPCRTNFQDTYQEDLRLLTDGLYSL